MPGGPRWIFGALVAIGLAISPTGRAAAHTDFEGSTPAAGDVVESPLTEIIVTFTATAQEAGEGFQVLDGTGTVRTPTSIEIAEERIFTLRFDPPIAPGEIGVRWAVSSGDGHPIEGSFTFTLTAPPPTTPPLTTPPPITVPATTAVLPATTADPPNSTTSTTTAVPPPNLPLPTVPPPTDLDAFLAGDGDPPGEGRQLVGRIISLPAAVLAIGALAFLAAGLRGTSREFALLLRGVGIAGAALIVGGAVEYSGWLAQSGESAGEAWSSTPGAAMMLRIVAGIALLAGSVIADPHARSAGTPPPALSAAVADAPPLVTRNPLHRWSWRSAPLVAVGAALVIASFWFDGHTVSRGPRVVHAVVSSVHVGAAGVWAGGVVAFAVIAWTRHRRGDASRATELIVRFSSIATIALVAVALAGVVMTALIIDGAGDLTATEWGKTLLVKVGAVAIAAAMGAFNHYRLRPALEQHPDDPVLAAELRRTLIAEVIVLVFIAVITAWLVAAAV